jgi:hypothetical protein
MFNYFIIALVECYNDSDCPKNMCFSPRIPWCVNSKCECVATYGPTKVYQSDYINALEERLISSTGKRKM